LLTEDSQKVFYATIYNHCFYALYFTEAGRLRKARANITDFAGFSSDSKQKKHLVKNHLRAFGGLSGFLS